MTEHERYPPDDPREWMNRARSNLQRARVRIPDVYIEDMCFDAQQATEKALKAVLMHRQIDFPFVHDIDHLILLLEEDGVAIPAGVRESSELTKYVVIGRYPFDFRSVREEEYVKAIKMAEAVVRWAEGLV